MSSATTKATIMLATTVTLLGAAATPALADDATTVAPTAQQTIADTLHWGARAAVAMAGIVLLAKLVQGYRRSQWRRHWLSRSTVLYVGSAQLGSISGRATSRSLTMSAPMSAPMAGGSVARSSTRL